MHYIKYLEYKPLSTEICDLKNYCRSSGNPNSGNEENVI